MAPAQVAGILCVPRPLYTSSPCDVRAVARAEPPVIIMRAAAAAAAIEPPVDVVAVRAVARRARDGDI